MKSMSRNLFAMLFLAPPAPGTGPVPLTARVVSTLVVGFGMAGILLYAFGRLRYGWNWEIIWEYREKFLKGWLITVGISGAALVISLALGVGTALARRTRFLPLRYLAATYVEVIRGTPLLVQILIFFYVVADAFGIGNRYLVGTLTLALFAAAYTSEIVRAGIDSVGKSQLDSARAIGLSRFQSYRYVVFPQVVRQILPPLAGQFASLVKDSSLLSVIAVGEFTLNAQEVNAYTYSTLESYLPLAAGYLLLTLPISLVARHLEQSFHYET
jgi:polar amino acid transport system permease protein